MGLDMYLYKKTWVSDNGLKLVEPDGKIQPERIRCVYEEIGYWRKANAIHNWFVQNIQDGNDDNEEYEVSIEVLMRLRNTCLDVLASCELVPGKISDGYAASPGEPLHEVFVDGQMIRDSYVAEQLLPTVSGFFFGGTDYDQYYVEDLKNTVKIIEEALKDEYATYIYSSSW